MLHEHSFGGSRLQPLYDLLNRSFVSADDQMHMVGKYRKRMD